MPRFFFEMSADREVLEDDEGYELSSAEQARSDALKTLAETSQSALSDGEAHRFHISVRTEAKQLIFEAEATLRSRWVK